MATPVKLCAAKHVDSQPDLARKMKNRLRSLRHGRLESSSLEYKSLTIHSLSASLSVLTASYPTYPPTTSVAEWLACWTQAQKGPGSNRSRDAVG